MRETKETERWRGREAERRRDTGRDRDMLTSCSDRDNRDIETQRRGDTETQQSTHGCDEYTHTQR